MLKLVVDGGRWPSKQSDRLNQRVFQNVGEIPGCTNVQQQADKKASKSRSHTRADPTRLILTVSPTWMAQDGHLAGKSMPGSS